jgi:hypothetical protein
MSAPPGCAGGATTSVIGTGVNTIARDAVTDGAGLLELTSRTARTGAVAPADAPERLRAPGPPTVTAPAWPRSPVSSGRERWPVTRPGPV